MRGREANVGMCRSYWQERLLHNIFVLSVEAAAVRDPDLSQMKLLRYLCLARTPETPTALSVADQLSVAAGAQPQGLKDFQPQPVPGGDSLSSQVIKLQNWQGLQQELQSIILLEYFRAVDRQPAVSEEFAAEYLLAVEEGVKLARELLILTLKRGNLEHKHAGLWC